MASNPIHIQRQSTHSNQPQSHTSVLSHHESTSTFSNQFLFYPLFLFMRSSPFLFYLLPFLFFFTCLLSFPFFFLQSHTKQSLRNNHPQLLKGNHPAVINRSHAQKQLSSSNHPHLLTNAINLLWSSASVSNIGYQPSGINFSRITCIGSQLAGVNLNQQ